ncbi:unnamed protein product, partial [Choristocarpus tenellus]
MSNRTESGSSLSASVKLPHGGVVGAECEDHSSESRTGREH